MVSPITKYFCDTFPRAKKTLLFFCLSISTYISAQTDWELQKNENGISVYTKDQPNSGFKEIKAVATFNSSLSGLIALLTDIPSHPTWLYRCKQTKLLKTISSTELYYYVETYVPWPVSNRDGVIYFKTSQDSKTKVVTVSSRVIPGMLPENKGVVRVPKLVSSWRFTPKGDGTVSAEYQLDINPGGDVPPWIVNMFSVEGPYESIMSMRKKLVEVKYKSAKFDFITE